VPFSMFFEVLPAALRAAIVGRQETRPPAEAGVIRRRPGPGALSIHSQARPSGTRRWRSEGCHPCTFRGRILASLDPLQGAKAIRVFVADRREPAETLERAAQSRKDSHPESIWIRDSQSRSMPIRVPVIRAAVIIVQLALSAAIGPIVGSIPRKSWRAAQLLLRYIGTISA
jgi:hypothetical protein